MNIEASEVIVWQLHSEETHHVNQSDLFLRKLGFLDKIFSKKKFFYSLFTTTMYYQYF